MTYIQQKAKAIAESAGSAIDEDTDLYLLYAVLCLTKGKETTLKDVHEAWAAWKHIQGFHKHESLIPFSELTLKVRELDRPYMEAIHACA